MLSSVTRSHTTRLDSILLPKFVIEHVEHAKSYIGCFSDKHADFFALQKSMPVSPGTLKILLIVSDGYVGNMTKNASSYNRYSVPSSSRYNLVTYCHIQLKLTTLEQRQVCYIKLSEALHQIEGCQHQMPTQMRKTAIGAKIKFEFLGKNCQITFQFFL